MKYEHIVDGCALITDFFGERIRGLHGKTAAIKCGVERNIADCDCARGRMTDHFTELEIFKETPGIGFAHDHRSLPHTLSQIKADLIAV